MKFRDQRFYALVLSAFKFEARLSHLCLSQAHSYGGPV